MGVSDMMLEYWLYILLPSISIRTREPKVLGQS